MNVKKINELADINTIKKSILVDVDTNKYFVIELTDGNILFVNNNTRMFDDLIKLDNLEGVGIKKFKTKTKEFFKVGVDFE